MAQTLVAVGGVPPDLHPPTEFRTTNDRLIWLLETKFGGRRSAMSKATGVTLSSLIKVVTRQREAGRRMLDKITKNIRCNPTWLFTGTGDPFQRTSGLVVKHYYDLGVGPLAVADAVVGDFRLTEPHKRGIEDWLRKAAVPETLTVRRETEDYESGLPDVVLVLLNGRPGRSTLALNTAVEFRVRPSVARADT